MLNWLKEQAVKALRASSRWTASAASRLAPISQDAAFQARLTQWRELWFVADIPLFIDDQAVRQLFDALVRPEFEVTAKRAIDAVTRGSEESGEFGASGSAGVAPFLSGHASVKLAERRSKSRTQTTDLAHEANRSAERRLEQIIHYYVLNFPKRVFWATTNLSELQDLDGASVAWKDVAAKIDEAAPRPLIVLNMPQHTKLIPMAAESTNGKVKRLYDSYRNLLDLEDEFPPHPGDAVDKHRSYSKPYWEAMDAAFKSKVAMEVVENCTASGERVEWIDYRLIARSEGDIVPLHLHLAPRGRFATGTFAYQSVRRAWSYGLRMVGTLKQGEDINVLAAYEK